MFVFLVLQLLVGTGNCFTCYSSDPIDPAQTCEADDLCYTISSKDSVDAECAWDRGCLKAGFNFKSRYFKDYLIQGDANPGLFSVCDSTNCNKEKPDCNQKDFEQMWEDTKKNLTGTIEAEKKLRQDIIDLNQKLKDAQQGSQGYSGLAVAAGWIFAAIAAIAAVVFGILWLKKSE